MVYLNDSIFDRHTFLLTLLSTSSTNMQLDTTTNSVINSLYNYQLCHQLSLQLPILSQTLFIRKLWNCLTFQFSCTHKFEIISFLES